MHVTRMLVRAIFAAAPVFMIATAPVAQVPFQPAHPGWLQAALEGDELGKDKEYAAGSRVKSTRLGISLKVPEGVTASLLPGGNALQLKGESRWGIVAMRTGVSVDEAKKLFTEEMDLSFLNENAVAMRSGAPAVDGNKVTADYTAVDEEEGMAGRAQAVVGEKGAGYAVVILCKMAAVAKAAVNALADSVTWAAPESEKELGYWRAQVEGQRLTLTGEGGSVTCDIKKDATFSLTSKSDQGEQTVAGKWRIEIGPACGFLVLTLASGEVEGMTLAIDGKEIVVQGAKYSRAPIDGKAADVAKEPAREPDKEAPKEGVKGEGKLERPAEAADKGKTRKVTADPNWKSDVKEVEKLEGDEMQFNVPYAGEKRIKTDFLGVSFVVPAGVKGGSDGKTPVFAMRPDDQRGLGLIFLQTGVNNAATAVALLHEDQDLSDLEKGVMLKPDGDAKIEGGKVTQDYVHDVYTARAVMLIGPSGNSIGVTFIGAKGDAEKLRAYVDGIIKSTQLAKPKAEEKRGDVKKNMGGKVFHIYRYKQAGSGSNSSSWETKIWYHFGSDDTFFYQYRFTGDHYVKGVDSGGNQTHSGGAWSNNNNDIQGTWRIEFNIAGIVLVLKAENGDESVHQIRLDGTKVFLNGEEVGVSKSDKKQ